MTPTVRPALSHSRLRQLVLALFFLSGLGALTYEVLWVRMLGLAFGVSVYAVSAVLTAFMGGLALGSWIFGAAATRAGARPGAARSLLRLYAVLLAGVAVFALLCPWIFRLLTDLYAWTHHQWEPGFYVYNLYRFGMATLVLLLPTTLMGGTLPILSQLLAREPGRRGSDLGALYAVNTFGGVVGTIAVGFLLLRELGVQGTIFTIAAVDLAAAAFAWILGQISPGDTAAGPAARSHLPENVEEGGPARQARFALWGFALSGFAALGYEVIWTRLLTLVSLNTFLSFAIMLATFLVGLAGGSALARRLADRWERPLALFGYLQVGIGVSAVLVLFLFTRLATVVGEVVQPDTVTKQVAAEFLGAGLTMLLPTLLMGAAFPVAARLYSGRAGSVGASIGRLYALNTVGAALGAFLTGFVLIPTLGLQRSALLLALSNLALGTLAVTATASSRKLVPVAGFAAAGVAALLLPPGIYLGAQHGWSSQLVFYEEGIDATVSVFERSEPRPMKISYVNGRSEVPTDPVSMRAFYLLGHLPPLLHPEARSALMLSFGNGIASGCLSRHGVPRIHAVELVEGQIRAAKLYEKENRGVLRYPGFTITNEDGRNYLLRGDEKFDIITTDATHPINSSSWALFTREFYLLVRERMAGDGVFMQWLPFHNLSLDDYRDIVKTFESVFPYPSLWYTSGTHTSLVATPQPLTRARVAALDQRIRALGLLDDLGDMLPLTRTFVLDHDEVRAFVSGARVVTDDSAYFMPHANQEEEIARSLARFQDPG